MFSSWRASSKYREFFLFAINGQLLDINASDWAAFLHKLRQQHNSQRTSGVRVEVSYFQPILIFAKRIKVPKMWGRTGQGICTKQVKEIQKWPQPRLDKSYYMCEMSKGYSNSWSSSHHIYVSTILNKFVQQNSSDRLKENDSKSLLLMAPNDDRAAQSPRNQWAEWPDRTCENQKLLAPGEKTDESEEEKQTTQQKICACLAFNIRNMPSLSDMSWHE